VIGCVGDEVWVENGFRLERDGCPTWTFREL
jgi:hypothetical protein